MPRPRPARAGAGARTSGPALGPSCAWACYLGPVGDADRREPPEPDETALALPGSRRAAHALEDAGELRAAARLFEYIGEHGQAAALRLEHASTVGDDEERVAILREGAVRIGGRTPEGRELHRALARVLVERAASMPPSAQRRAIVLEAAQSYESAGEGERAGQIYERMGLMRRAEVAYRDAGAIDAYERVLQALEDREQALKDLRQLQHSIDEALREGRRGQARELLRDHVARRRERGRSPKAHLLRELAELEAHSPREGRIELHWTQGAQRWRTKLVVAPAFQIGRAPGVDLRVEAPAVSRRHLVLALGDDSRGRPAIVVEDLASKAGSFVDGEALMPGERLELLDPCELAIGIAQTWHWEPGPPSHSPFGLLGPLGEDGRGWLLFAPDGAPLCLEPEFELPARVRSAGDFIELACAANCALELGGRILGSGVEVQLIVGDRGRLVFDGAHLDFEVRAWEAAP